MEVERALDLVANQWAPPGLGFEYSGFRQNDTIPNIGFGAGLQTQFNKSSILFSVSNRKIVGDGALVGLKSG